MHTQYYLTEAQVRDLIPISLPRWSTWKRNGWTPRQSFLPGKVRPVFTKEDVQRWLDERERQRRMLGKPYLRRLLDPAELREEVGKLAVRAAAKTMEAA